MPLTEALRAHAGQIAARAALLDEGALFPLEDVACLVRLGLAKAPLPAALGGAGAGTQPGGALALFGLLRLLGQANLSLARLYEAHVNVARLVVRYGAADQSRAFAADCRQGLLYGLWVTDAPGQTVRRDNGRLSGQKGPCSGAGHLRRALVTVTEGDSVRMALISLTGQEPVTPLGSRLLGMRASANGVITLDDVVVADAAIIGQDGDYLREPDLSTGAWRTMAATLGGLDALTGAVRAQLRARGHAEAPLQQARFGAMLIGQETARLWTWQAAQCSETADTPAADQVAYVNLARIAIEAACLDAMRHAQRALGLAALVRPNPVERLLRDLTTYLRQPAPDSVLTEAARHELARA